MTRRPALLAVLLLAALQAMANLYWLDQDEGIQYTDAAFHYSQIIEHAEALSQGSQAMEQQRLNDEKLRYGSLFYYLAAPLALVGSSTANSILMGLSVLLWPLLLLGCHALGAELADSKQRHRTGLLCAAIAGLLPGLFNYSRVLVLDLTLAITVCWSTALLLRSLRSPGSPGIPGATALLTMAAGLAIKVNALAFLAGPLWIAGSAALSKAAAGQPRRQPLRFIAIFMGALLLTGWLLLGSRGAAILETARDSTWPGKLIGYASQGSLGQYANHYLSFVRSQSWEVLYYSTLQSFTPLWLAAVIVACAAYFVRPVEAQHKKVERQRQKLVFSALAIPLFGVIFVLRDIYDERYLIPLLPLCAALTARASLAIAHARCRVFIISLGLLAGSLNFNVISFNVLPELRPLACTTAAGWAPKARVGDRLWLCALYPEYHFMDRSSSPLPRTVAGPLLGQKGELALHQVEQLLAPLRAELNRPLAATFLDDLYEFFYRSYNHSLAQAGSREALFRHQDLHLLSKCTDRPWLEALFESLQGIEQTIAQSDVVIMRFGNPSDPSDTALRGRRCIIFWQQQQDWRHLGDVDLADGTSIRLYRRRSN
ncbi:MAG: hypothetical protein CMP23_17410 [Rickettsiales bacterium]|nr:hypothetical protein [Rickettsiales bacterium]